MITHEANGHTPPRPLLPTHTEAFAEVVKKIPPAAAGASTTSARSIHLVTVLQWRREKFKESCLITDEVIGDHPRAEPSGPCTTAGTWASRVRGTQFGNIPMVAVFDTAFHSTMPPKAYMYAIPYEYYDSLRVRRRWLPRHQPHLLTRYAEYLKSH